MPQASVEGPTAPVFVNELHYDNAGTDAGEGIEVAGPAGTDLTGWSLVLYNGSTGASYLSTTLSGVIPDQKDGFGTLAVSYPPNGLQNGGPDGVALVNTGGAVIQFLSYEGSFTATDGPAAGRTSTDIGVVETGETPLGASLQLTGSAAQGFAWTGPADDSFGAVNAGQDFSGEDPTDPTGPGILSVAGAEVAEGDEGPTELTFTVTRAGGSAGAVTVDYRVLPGAEDPADDDTGALPSGTLTFAEGETAKTIAVEVTGDADIEPDETLRVELSNATGGAAIEAATAVGTILNDDLPFTAIGAIQGAGHVSPLLGQEVSTAGIVTVVDANGFYLQDAAGDGDGATSDAIFVFTGSEPSVGVGDEVAVSGTVSEFTPGGASSGNLSTTQIGGSPEVAVLSADKALPEAVELGPDGRQPPTEIIDDDEFASFDPAADGIDFYESLEGMRVTVQAPVAVAPTTRFGEIYTVASDGAGGLLATNVSERGTVNIEGGEGSLEVTNTGAGSDFNPERIQVQADGDFTPGSGVPQVDAGAQLDDVTGVVSYGFGSYEVLATEAIEVASPSALRPEVTDLKGGKDRLTVATYNVLNLDPNDGDDSTDVADGQFEAVAQDIAVNLRAPDIVALQEIQDNDGATDSDVTAADATLQLLVDELFEETGIRYEYVDNPFIVDDASGGEPGGNIRTAYLYNSGRVDLVEGSLATVVDPADQAKNPDNPFFDARLPLVATFEFDDEEVTLIDNHFSSKGGSTPLFGATQPPINGSAEQRAEQAQAVNDYVDGLVAADAEAKVVVLGDLNEFEFEEQLQILEGDSTEAGATAAKAGASKADTGPDDAPEAEGGVLTNLTFQLDPDERYSYIFEGNSQSLDHILVTEALLDGARFDAVHINSEFVDAASDHDPLVASLRITDEKDQRLRGGNGPDALEGGDGDDVLRGGNGADTLAGGRDDDRLQGENGNDRLFGDDVDDPLGGEDAGDDTLEGGNGNDKLLGGGGDDTLVGGRGNDGLAGGEGDDAFVFSERGFGLDTVADFATGEDILDFGCLDLSLGAIDSNGDGVVDASDRGATLAGGDLLITLRGGGIRLNDVSTLGADDFLF